MPDLRVVMEQVEGERETRFLQRSLLDAGPFPPPCSPLGDPPSLPRPSYDA